MAGTIQQPRNPVIDMIDASSKALPMLFGSKSEQAMSADPAELERSRAMINSLVQRSSSTAQADQIVEDILYRAKLAFAPVLGEEKQAGMYNTTVRSQLARESVARATAASAQAVMQDQQKAMEVAASLQAANVKATSKQTTKQKGQGKNALMSIAAANLPGMLKKAKAAFDGPGAASASDLMGDEFTAGLEEAFSSDIGALNPVGGMDVGFDIGQAFDGGTGSAEEMLSVEGADALPGAGIGDAPSIIEGGEDALTGGANALPGFTPDLITAGTNAGLSMETMQTIGPIATQKALETAASGGFDMMPPAIELGLEGADAAGAAAEGYEAFEGAEAVYEAGSEVAATVGGEVAAEVGGEVAAEAGGMVLGDLYFPGIFTAANYVTDGMLTETVGQIAEVGNNILSGLEELGHDLPGDPILDGVFGSGTSDRVLSFALDTVDDPLEFVGDAWESIEDACFMTTAATKAGEADDGRTLQTMREFRDSYMNSNAERKLEVLEYYHIAPNVVRSINAKQNSEVLWKKIREDYLAPCVAAFEQGKPEVTHRIYQNMMSWAHTQIGAQNG